MKKIKEKYRKMKNLINPNVGKILERIFFFIMIIGTFIFVPIALTIFSTLSGSGSISHSVYLGIFYTTWSVIIISFILWIFFKEYKHKEINSK